jgi:plastocyanin
MATPVSLLALSILVLSAAGCALYRSSYGSATPESNRQGAAVAAPDPAPSSVVAVRLSEWKVELSQTNISQGAVTFNATNVGTIPHAFEVEGQGIEKETSTIQPNASASLTMTLAPGTYEVYCPVGEDSHKKLGMVTKLVVTAGPASAPAPY